MAALKWYSGLKQAILILEGRPTRCPITRKRDRLKQLFYRGKSYVYRVLFVIKD